jgi:tRNA(Arg) A34 adenosine deaminase TadA
LVTVAAEEARQEHDDPFGIAARLATEAAATGTFGVGGVLADASGRVLATARNAVIAPGMAWDPTAHVERQLIDWYFANGSHRAASGGLTIVSSLEPCMMCAGSILRAGFHCVSLADHPFAGVGVRTGFQTLPPALRRNALAQFGSAAVRGRRAFLGSGTEPFRKPTSADDLARAERALNESLEAVRRTIGGPISPVNPTGESLGLDVVTRPTGPHWVADGPTHDVAQFVAIARNLDASGPAAGLADDAGHLLCVTTGRLDRSPIRTAVMECVRRFSTERAGLERRFARDLPPPALTLLVAGEFHDDEEAIISLGAAGSFVESPLAPGRPPFVKLVGARVSSVAHVDDVLGRFPPFYRDFVGLRVDGAR